MTSLACDRRGPQLRSVLRSFLVDFWTCDHHAVRPKTLRAKTVLSLTLHTPYTCLAMAFPFGVGREALGPTTLDATAHGYPSRWGSDRALASSRSSRRDIGPDPVG